MLSDAPAVRDELDRSKLVRAVGDRIHSCAMPQVFAICGDWGSGKTSFLRQLQRYVSGRCAAAPEWRPGPRESHPHCERATVVWFEAWRYQDEAQPVIALLHEIRQQLSAWLRSLDEAKKITDVALRSMFACFDDAAKQVRLGGLSKVQEIGEKYEAGRHETLLGTESLRRYLQEAIGKLVSSGAGGKGLHRLVILVDDLDRCNPEAAYKLLEGIKAFLNLENCVFVLGMNPEIVEQGLSKVYKDMGVDHHVVACEYLEKICQSIWHLPIPPEPAEYLRGQLALLVGNGADQSKLAQKRAFFDSVADAAKAERCLAPNPRRVKALANLLERMYERRVPPPEGDNPFRDPRIALVYAYLYQACQPIYRILQVEPGFYESVLLPWAKNPPQETAGLHPTLASLRPVARAKAQDDKEPGPSSAQLASTYPDPLHEGYLRVQNLVVELGRLTDTELARYRSL